jgi:drug/metabolite transporter (DMT)-like permease
MIRPLLSLNMKANDSATLLAAPPISRTGLWWAALGVLAFSFTVPFTRIAVEGMSPLFIGAGRAVIAAALAAAALAFAEQRVPHRSLWLRLAVVAAGVVAGFGLLTSFALTEVPASHGAVVIALLPAATAAMTVIRTRERPPAKFWTAAVLGAVAALAFAALGNGGLGGLHWPDLLLFAAVLAAAIGYAEGGLLARELGAWQTISWALVLAAPVMILATAFSLADGLPHAAPAQWAAFAYLAVVSQFLGFFAWYRGLALGPMAQVSQTQLVQPVLTISWAALLLGEPLTWPTAAGAVAVIACAALAIRTRLR